MKYCLATSASNYVMTYCQYNASENAQCKIRHYSLSIVDVFISAEHTKINTSK
jgi:hypothetical protein